MNIRDCYYPGLLLYFTITPLSVISIVTKKSVVIVCTAVESIKFFKSFLYRIIIRAVS